MRNNASHEGASPSKKDKSGSEGGPLARVVALGILGAIGAAALGYVVNLLDDHRKREIEFVRQQIEQVYGPLFALSTASAQAWSKLRLVHRQGHVYYFDDNDRPT